MPASLSDRLSPKGVGPSSRPHRPTNSHHDLPPSASRSSIPGPSSSRMTNISAGPSASPTKVSRFPNPLKDDGDDDEEEGAIVEESPNSKSARRGSAAITSARPPSAVEAVFSNGRNDTLRGRAPPSSLPLKPPPPSYDLNPDRSASVNGKHRDHSTSTHSSRPTSPSLVSSESAPRHRLSRHRPLGGRHSDVSGASRHSTRPPSPTPSLLSRKRSRSPTPPPLKRTSSVRVKREHSKSRSGSPLTARLPDGYHRSSRPDEQHPSSRHALEKRRADDYDRNDNYDRQYSSRSRTHRLRDRSRSPSVASTSTSSTRSKPLPAWKYRDEAMLTASSSSSRDSRYSQRERDRDRERDRHRDAGPRHLRERDPDKDYDRHRDHRRSRGRDYSDDEDGRLDDRRSKYRSSRDDDRDGPMYYSREDPRDERRYSRQDERFERPHPREDDQHDKRYSRQDNPSERRNSRENDHLDRRRPRDDDRHDGRYPPREDPAQTRKRSHRDDERDRSRSPHARKHLRDERSSPKATSRPSTNGLTQVRPQEDQRTSKSISTAGASTATSSPAPSTKQSGASRWSQVTTAAAETAGKTSTSDKTSAPTSHPPAIPSGPKATHSLLPSRSSVTSPPGPRVPTGPRASRAVANANGSSTPASTSSIPSGPRALSSFRQVASGAAPASSSSPATPRTPDSTTATATTAATSVTSVASTAGGNVEKQTSAEQDLEDAPPPPPPVALSFGHTLLPNELPSEQMTTAWRLTYDPQLERDKTKVAAKGKQVIREFADVSKPAACDPRLSNPARSSHAQPIPTATFLSLIKASLRRGRPSVEVPTWKWTKNSTTPRPPPPARAVVMTGISPLMTSVQLRSHFRAFGRIQEHELKMDPKTGQSLGIFWLQFAHDFEPKEDEEGDGKLVAGAIAPGQRAHECAAQAVRELQGKKLGAGTRDAVPVHIELDADKSMYVKAYRRELAHRYAAESQAKAKAKAAADAATAKMAHDHRPAVVAHSSQDSPLVFSGNATPAHVADRWQARHGGSIGTATPASAAPIADTPETYAAIKARLAVFGTPYIFIARPHGGNRVSSVMIQGHFKMFSPTAVMFRDDEHQSGWYVAFNSKDAARRAKGVLEQGPLATGYRLELDVREAPTLTSDRRRMIQELVGSSSSRGSAEPADDENPGKKASTAAAIPRRLTAREALIEKTSTKGWTVSDLVAQVGRTLKRQLEEVFLRDVRNRVLGPSVSDFLKGDAKGGRMLQESIRIAAEEREREREASEADASQHSRGSLTPSTPQHPLGDKPAADGEEDANDTVSGGVVNGQLPSFRKIKRKQTAAGTTAQQSAIKLPPGFSVVDKEDLAKRAAEARALLKGGHAGVQRDDAGKMTDEEAVAAASVVDDEMLGLAAAAEESEEETVRGKKKPTSKKGAKKAAPAAKGSSAAGKKHRMIYSSDSSEEEEEAAAAKPVKSKQTGVKNGRGKGGKKGVQFALDEDDDEEPSASATPVPADDSVESHLKAETAVLSKLKVGKKKGASGAVRARETRSPTPDPFGLGIAEDEEDLYYVRLALERIRSGEGITAASMPLEEDVEDEEDEDMDESGGGRGGFKFATAHDSGSARTEGFYKIPPSLKAVHLPERNEATVEMSSAGTTTLSSARDHRADSRRLVLGIEQHKKDTATDTDILKFNQLRSRKKQLKFAKSPIHDWGLYAMESIPAGDMVIEYVGEMVRQQVADHRERMYEKQGNFSTYLFRVDDDLVVDATHKGNIARLMNHCCVPNCTAKILTLNGKKRIVIFAKERIHRDQELTYDYKLGGSGDIPCLCGVEGCRKWL